MPEFSDYLVFVDESGDHGMASVDPNYPAFVLACCLVSKVDYVERISPALQRLKFAYWGHDEQVLHEHEIRKPNKDYSFLFDASRRAAFLTAINEFVEQAPFKRTGRARDAGRGREARFTGGRFS